MGKIVPEDRQIELTASRIKAVAHPLRLAMVCQLAQGEQSVNEVCKLESTTLAIGKEAFYRQAELPLSAAYAYTRDVMVANLEAQDAQEGINAFIDKRQPSWCGR